MTSGRIRFPPRNSTRDGSGSVRLKTAPPSPGAKVAYAFPPATHGSTETRLWALPELSTCNLSNTTVERGPGGSNVIGKQVNPLGEALRGVGLTASLSEFLPRRRRDAEAASD